MFRHKSSLYWLYHSFQLNQNSPFSLNICTVWLSIHTVDTVYWRLQLSRRYVVRWTLQALLCFISYFTDVSCKGISPQLRNNTACHMSFYMILIGPASECRQVRDKDFVLGNRTKRVEDSFRVHFLWALYSEKFLKQKNNISIKYNVYFFLIIRWSVCNTQKHSYHPLKGPIK